MPWCTGTKRHVIFSGDKIELLTYDEEELEVVSCVLLYKDVMKNFEEQMEEIIEKFQKMENGELKEEYESYLGDKIYISMKPKYNNILLTKYDIEEENDAVYEIVDVYFAFKLSDFKIFLKEWSEKTKHFSLHEMVSTCSPKTPCSEKSCYNCKM